MSKFNIGVGDEFPLDESPDRKGRHGRHRHRRHMHHHFHPHHHHRRHGILHLPLLIAVAVIAAAVGAGRIQLFATPAILAAIGVAVLLALLAHWYLHRRHRRGV